MGSEMCIRDRFYRTTLDHLLINPNQVRHYGLPFWDNPYNTTCRLWIKTLEIDIPMETNGTKIQFVTRVPTQSKLQSCQHIQMTSPRPWNPQAIRLQSVTSNGRPGTVNGDSTDITSDKCLLCSVNPCLVTLKELATQCTWRITQQGTRHTHDNVPVCRMFISTERHANITANALAEHFGIGPI